MLLTLNQRFIIKEKESRQTVGNMDHARLHHLLSVVEMIFLNIHFLIFDDEPDSFTRESKNSTAASVAWREIQDINCRQF